ncbi:hypothetical protein BGZ63DRAFT_186394 [Mariannaea sp. PMI_226]|nr:hypothetical protein BGZ63DRAFT_186394 [Mariannaea sp. PMI_226]
MVKASAVQEVVEGREVRERRRGGESKILNIERRHEGQTWVSPGVASAKHHVVYSSSKRGVCLVLRCLLVGGCSATQTVTGSLLCVFRAGRALCWGCAGVCREALRDPEQGSGGRRQRKWAYACSCIVVWMYVCMRVCVCERLFRLMLNAEPQRP